MLRQLFAKKIKNVLLILHAKYWVIRKPSKHFPHGIGDLHDDILDPAFITYTSVYKSNAFIGIATKFSYDFVRNAALYEHQETKIIGNGTIHS